MIVDEFESLLEAGEESQSVDYKASCPWSVDSYIKDILAMGNVDGGGYIVIGVVENVDIDDAIDFSKLFFRTLEDRWYKAEFPQNIRLQRSIFPNGVNYHFPEFSNPKISCAFSLIRESI